MNSWGGRTVNYFPPLVDFFPPMTVVFPADFEWISKWEGGGGIDKWSSLFWLPAVELEDGLGKKKSSSIQLRGILFLKWCLAEGDGHCCHFRPDGDKLLVDFSLVGNTVGPAGPCGGWVTWAVEEPETEAFSETLGSKCFLKNYKLSCRVSIWKEWFTPGHDSTNTSYVQ